MIKTVFSTTSATREIYDLAGRFREKYNSRLDDHTFAKKWYKEATGRSLNLDAPHTFDEKLWWLKFHDHDPLLTECSDKYLVRDYVSKCGLAHILTRLYGVWDKPEEIDFEQLPNKFYLKLNRGSGNNIACRNKSRLDKKKTLRKLNKYLRHDTSLRLREWNYKNIVPRIICEEFLEPSQGQPLVDYKFYCFNGIPKTLIYTTGVVNTDGSHVWQNKVWENYYDINFEPLPVSDFGCRRLPENLVHKPDDYQYMVHCAKKLAKPFPFVRVDLYNIDGQVKFGELTFYSGGGIHDFAPAVYNLKFGKMLDITGFGG